MFFAGPVSGSNFKGVIGSRGMYPAKMGPGCFLNTVTLSAVDSLAPRPLLSCF